MAAIQRDFLHGFVVNYLTEAGGRRLHNRCVGIDFHLLGHLTDFEWNIFGNRGRHVKFEFLDHSLAKSRGADFDVVRANRKAGEEICASAVCLRSPLFSRVHIAGRT